MNRLRVVLPLAVLTLASGCMVFVRPPKEPQRYERTQPTAGRIYQVSYSPTDTIRLRQLHTWNLRVVTAAGTPVEQATITVDGGMPQHGHGLPTQPRVTRYLGEGTHLVEGMRFNMGGWWVVKVRIAGTDGTDSVTFNLKL
jgi:hypothetical protein